MKNMKNPHVVSATRRRLCAATLTACAVAASAWVAPPALAAASITVSPSDATFTTPGTVQLSAAAEETSSLKTIQGFEVTLSSTDTTPAFSATVTHANVFKRTDSICLAWNPGGTSAKGGALPSACGSAPATPVSVANGTYRLTSTVWTCTVPVVGALGCIDTPAASAGPSRTLKVSIAPKVPGEVKARLDASPIVTWAANPEPDVTGYRIYRSDVNKQVGTVVVSGDPAKATSWTDPCSESAPCTPGTGMAYKVAAVRRSPAGSAVSEYSAASEAVALAAPPPGGPVVPAVPGNPLSIPAPVTAPLPAVKAPVKQIVAPAPISDKYAPTLPYAAPLPQQGTAPVQAPAPAAEPTQEQEQQQQAAAQTVTEQRLPKLQFIAGALVLLVIALHLARGGGMLLKGSPKAPETGSTTASLGQPR